MHQEGRLERLRVGRSQRDPAFHVSLEHMDMWLPFSDGMSPRLCHLTRDIRSMLSRKPEKRLEAQHLISRLSLCDKMMEHTGRYIFGDCCRVGYVAESDHMNRVRSLEWKAEEVSNRLKHSQSEVDAFEKDEHVLRNKNKSALKEVKNQLFSSQSHVERLTEDL